MDNTEIFLITINDEGKQVQTVTTVDDLIDKWNESIDVPTNDDTVMSCVLGKTPLYFETFGEMMLTLTGSGKGGFSYEKEDSNT